MWFDTIVACAGFMLLWAIAWCLAALAFKRNDVADVAWGLGFILCCLVASCTATSEPIPSSSVGKVVLALVTIWGVRLSYHIAKRNLKKSEDYRYKALREQWGKWFALRSFVQVFLLQAVLTIIVAMPALAVTQAAEVTWSFWAVAGVAIWIFGFSFEAIGDWQLKQFLKRRTDKNNVMQTGLWRYTRHPNYFGEVTQWWGLFVIALGVPKGWWAVLGPIMITYLIVKVSGIPMLEQKMLQNPAYKTYAKRTSIFVPWFNKSI